MKFDGATFASEYPERTSEWDYEKNAPLKPSEITPKSNKKYWWVCPKGHSYHMAAYNRAIGQGCPYCAGKRVSPEMSLGAKFPELISEWHPTKNGNLTPFGVMPGSVRKVWWRCPKGHEWSAVPLARTYSRSGCPYCSGAKAAADTSLAALNPSLAEQWHPNKNGDLTPDQVTLGSNKKVWWLCSRGHEWKADVYGRHAKGYGCPQCSGVGTSVLELRVYSELKALFPDLQWRSKEHGVEFDLWIPSIATAVEIDGYIWHKARPEKDLEKSSVARDAGVTLIHLRQAPLPLIDPWDIAYNPNQPELDLLNRLVSTIGETSANEHIVAKAQSYAEKKHFLADAAFRKLVANLPAPPEGESFASRFPDLAKEWHLEKNAPLLPTMFLPFSDRKVWWQCRSGHEYEARIAKRATGRNCPICSNHPINGKIHHSNSLGEARPDLALQWDVERNKPLSPADVSPGSRQPVWWICPVCKQSWQAPLHQRARKAARPTCPACSVALKGDRVRATKLKKSGSLSEKAPEVAKSWHPTRNELTPEMVSPGSSMQVWWQCDQGHEWKAVIHGRVAGRGCPHCYTNRKSALKKCPPHEQN